MAASSAEFDIAVMSRELERLDESSGRFEPLLHGDACFASGWNEVVAEASADEFKRVYDSYAAFRKEYAIWKEHGYLQ